MYIVSRSWNAHSMCTSFCGITLLFTRFCASSFIHREICILWMKCASLFYCNRYLSSQTERTFYALKWNIQMKYCKWDDVLMLSKQRLELEWFRWSNIRTTIILLTRWPIYMHNVASADAEFWYPISIRLMSVKKCSNSSHRH